LLLRVIFGAAAAVRAPSARAPVRCIAVFLGRSGG